jgi:glutamyl-tRNA synthetase
MTEVIRGADLLPSTPRQIALYRALRKPVPRFAHVGLVVDPDGRRLSKRDGASPIEASRAAGAQPEEVIGRLAWSLGLTPTPTPIRAAELVSGFTLGQIPRASFVWDPEG